MKNSKLGWTGFDLDGTLAEYHGWTGSPYHIGKPIPSIVKIAKDLLAAGEHIKILTARASVYDPNTLVAIEQWCEEHLGQVVPITCQKDYNMIQLYDDRAVQVETNTGRIVENLEIFSLLDDLHEAIQKGWLHGDDQAAYCNYCGASAEHSPELKGYVADHEEDCLMNRWE